MNKSLGAQNVQNEVTDLLKREVVLMREILASMYEEEKALVEKDFKALQYLMNQRDAPLQNLMEVREERSQKIQELLYLLSNGKNKKQNSAKNLSTLLEAKGLDSLEVIILRDQIIALIEKMNEQHTTNEQIMQQSSHFWQDLMSYDPHPEIPHRIPIDRRKAIMLTVINPDI